MKSPFTGGPTSLHKEKRAMHFRKEPFDIWFHYYLCEDSAEQFTTDELDEVNINQVHNQYREKYGIPFPDEIRAIREQYGLSANKISEVLGLGINVYRNYESGEVPSVSNGRLIQMVKDPKEFMRLIDYSKNEFTSEESEKMNRKIQRALAGWNEMENISEIAILGEKRPSAFNGYRIPNLDKASNMILFFTERMKPFKTKLNKLLFYTDFLHFKRTCFSVSGLTYHAIQKGPVPKNYDWLFDKALEKKLVTVQLQDFGEYMGEQFVPTGDVQFEKELFIESELKALDTVAAYFEKATVNTIVQKSHEENAWIENVEDFRPINYNYSFDLRYP